MKHTTSDSPLLLRRSVRKALLLLIGSLILAAGGVLMAREQPVIGYACAIFFVLCALVGAVTLHPNSSSLQLTEAGFTFVSLFRSTTVPWSHVERFFPMKIYHNSMVGWNYSSSFDAQRIVRKVSNALAGVEAALPDTYGMQASELAALLNEYLAKHRREF